MPNFDGTGPEGKGPKTGRGLGDCKGKPKKKKSDVTRTGRRISRNNDEDFNDQFTTALRGGRPFRGRRGR